MMVCSGKGSADRRCFSNPVPTCYPANERVWHLFCSLYPLHIAKWTEYGMLTSLYYHMSRDNQNNHICYMHTRFRALHTWMNCIITVEIKPFTNFLNLKSNMNVSFFTDILRISAIYNTTNSSKWRKNNKNDFQIFLYIRLYNLFTFLPMAKDYIILAQNYHPIYPNRGATAQYRRKLSTVVIRIRVIEHLPVLAK